jgi:lipopolysaccharide biosynthesis regulator YciM
MRHNRCFDKSRRKAGLASLRHDRIDEEIHSYLHYKCGRLHFTARGF